MDQVFTTALRLGDNAMVLGQRLSHWISRSPTIELDIAFGNLSLDLIGQANLFYELAGKLEGGGRSADDLAFLRGPIEYFNVQLVEQPNGNFADSMMRQLLYVTYADIAFETMKMSDEKGLAAIAEKAQKEMIYHVRQSGEWVVRLGDGTDESHGKCQAALNNMWPWSHELFLFDDVDDAMVTQGVLPSSEALKSQWLESLGAVFERAGLSIPDDNWMPQGGRKGLHSEHLSYILEEMQVLPRAHPEAAW